MFRPDIGPVKYIIIENYRFYHIHDKHAINKALILSMLKHANPSTIEKQLFLVCVILCRCVKITSFPSSNNIQSNRNNLLVTGIYFFLFNYEIPLTKRVHSEWLFLKTCLDKTTTSLLQHFWKCKISDIYVQVHIITQTVYKLSNSVLLLRIFGKIINVLTVFMHMKLKLQRNVFN